MNSFLQEMNSRGILCSPGESLEAFQRRVELLKAIEQDPAIIQRCDLSYAVINKKKVTYSDLDINIDWMWFLSSRRQLSLWEPAATWILQLKGISIPLLQIKPGRQKLQEEILKHEAVHVARTAFEEPVYEEFLAYATSPSKWRRVWGPLFRSPKENIVFIAVSLLPLLGIYLPGKENFLFIPIAIFVGYLLIRLGIHHRRLTKTLLKIGHLFIIDSSLKIALRLSDREIRLFAFLSLKEAREYINNQTCLRWKQIISSYKLK